MTREVAGAGTASLSTGSEAAAIGDPARSVSRRERRPLTPRPSATPPAPCATTASTPSGLDGIGAKRRSLALRDGLHCFYCRALFPPARLTVEHLVPRSAGGTRALDNTVLACVRCNARVGALPLATKLSLRDGLLYADAEAVAFFAGRDAPAGGSEARRDHGSRRRRNRAASRVPGEHGAHGPDLSPDPSSFRPGERRP